MTERFESLVNEFRMHANAIPGVVDENLKEVVDTLSGKEPLPDGAPPRQEAALLVFENLQQRIDDLKALYHTVQKELSTR